MKDPGNVVTQLFVSTDQRDWSTVEKCFTSSVLLDYSSMTGAPSTTLSPYELISNWKGILPGFESTHHQIGNFLISQEGSAAEVFCYGTASHFLNDDAGSIWTVVGSYNFRLTSLPDGTWQISEMKFNFKYQTGNTSLAEKAMLAANKK